MLLRFLFITSGQENFTSPVSPAELLIALHTVDPSKVDLKTIIKGMLMKQTLLLYVPEEIVHRLIGLDVCAFDVTFIFFCFYSWIFLG